MNSAVFELVAERLQARNTVTITVATGSMMPLLPPGSTVRVGAATRARRGDILLVQRLPVPLLHRALAFDDTSVITKGDFSGQADGAVPRGAILGTVESVKCGDRWIDLRSRRGRRLGSLMAWLSLLHDRAGACSHRVVRAAAVYALRRGMRWLAYGILYAC